MDHEHSQMAASAISHAAHMAQASWQEAAAEWQSPHVTMRPKLSIDGNQWCALYGDNLQDGVAGFGESPYLAMCDFDRAWLRKLPANPIAAGRT